MTGATTDLPRPRLHRQRGAQLAVVLFALCLYVPSSGRYGLWDPWETNYSEVAREMLASGDYISLWDHRSAEVPFTFWSKPPLLFWCLSAGLRLAGIHAAGAPAAELATGWRAEWALRLPVIAFAAWALTALWTLVAERLGRRQAWLTTAVLATSSQWLLISRQVMTDIPFVALMTVATTELVRALLPPPDDESADGERALSERPFALALLALALVQLLVLARQLDGSIIVADYRISARVVLAPGFVALLPALIWIVRARERAQLQLAVASSCCGLATLTKGPAGLALPLLVWLVYAVVSRRYALLLRLRPWRSACYFLLLAYPWYAAMLARHGLPFAQEFFGDNHLQRALGRPGDRGGFEYYGLWLLAAVFPWSGLALSAIARRLVAGRDDARGDALIDFAFVWLVTELALISCVSTKFHHYLLPTLPALALLSAHQLEALLRGDRLARRLTLVAAPFTLLTGLLLAANPSRILWLFNYDYARQAGGLPWPAGAQYDFALPIVGCALAASLALAALALRRPVPASPDQRRPPSRWLIAWRAGALCVAAAACGAPSLWMLPALAALALITTELTGRRVGAAVALSLTVAIVWSAYLADHMLVALSAHGSQKAVIAQYYAQRRSAAEPLVAFQLDWHGEELYSKNVLMMADERTAFTGSDAPDELIAYVARHRGTRLFFVCERKRLEALRALLPEGARPSLRIADASNDNLYLARADIPTP